MAQAEKKSILCHSETSFGDFSLRRKSQEQANPRILRHVYTWNLNWTELKTSALRVAPSPPPSSFVPWPWVEMFHNSLVEFAMSFLFRCFNSNKQMCFFYGASGYFSSDCALSWLCFFFDRWHWQVAWSLDSCIPPGTAPQVSLRIPWLVLMLNSFEYCPDHICFLCWAPWQGEQ